MKNQDFKINTSSFEINKLITVSNLFSKVNLMLSSRLVLRCIVDYWNPKLGYAYPTQKTIARCTGLSEVSVGQAVKDLELKQLIKKVKVNKRIRYKFTISFLWYLELIPKVTLGDTQSSLGNIPKGALDNNILKENENAFLNNSLLNDAENLTAEEIPLTEKERAESFINACQNSPSLQVQAKIRKLKEKFELG